MTHDQLHDFLISGLNRILAHPVFLSQLDQQICQAQVAVLAGQDQTAVNPYLDAILSQLGANKTMAEQQGWELWGIRPHSGQTEPAYLDTYPGKRTAEARKESLEQMGWTQMEIRPAKEIDS